MAKYLPLPDGSSLEVPDDMSLNEAVARAKEAFPDLYAPKQQGKGPEGGFLASLKAGTSGLKSDVAALAGKTGLMDEDAAQKYIEEQKKYQAKVFKPTEAGWSEAPFTKAKELLGGSLPYMAAPVVAGAVAPAGAAALGATGLASLAQFTGSNLSRQMDEGKTLKETELGSAALAAVPQAALDVVSLKMLPGVRGIFGQAGKDVSPAAAKAFAEKGVAKIASDYALATGKAMTAEGLTEAGQQFFERMQAGLDLTDAKARDEYWESLVGGAVLGGAIAPAGRYFERGAEKSRLEVQRRREADTLAAQQREEARLAAEQKAADEAQAEAARKADPAYASQFLQDYEARFAEFKGIPLKKPGKDASFEEREIYQENKAKKAELGKQLAADTQEYRRLKALKAGEDAKAAELTAAEDQAKANEAMMQVEGAQADMFGAPVMTDMTNRPMPADQLPTPVQFTQQRAQLLNDREAIETKLAQAKTTAEHEAALAGLDTIDNELQKLNELRPQIEVVHGAIPKFGSAIEVDAALVKAKKKLADMTAKGASTDDDKAAIRKQLATIKELEQNQSLFGPGNARPADEAKLAAEMAAGREQSGQAQRTVNTEAAKLGKIGEKYQPTGEEYARDARQERKTQLEVEELEKQAAMDKSRTAQYTLFGDQELSSDQRSGTGALSTNSRARLQAALQIARATGNRQGVADAVAALKDLKAQEEAQAGAGQQTYSFAELEKTTGQKVPENVAAQQEAADARDTAYANMVDIVAQYNQGKAKKEALDRARDFLIENLAKDIETSRGTALTAAEQTQVKKQANELLDELVARFGDTRNTSSVGTKLDQAFQPAQNEDGTFNTEAVPGRGFFTAESKGPGYRTFASPYAAAMSIQEGLDSIRNKGVQGQLGATTTDVTLTPKETTPEMVNDQLGRLLSQAPEKTDPEVRKTAIQIADNLKALQGAYDTEADTAKTIAKAILAKKGQTAAGSVSKLDVISEYLSNPTPERTREVKALLAASELGKRSETEGGKTATQEELPGVEAAGTVFSSPEEFDKYLASDALAQIRKDQGLVTQTVSRLKAIAAPFAKKAEGLRAQLAALQARYAEAQKVSAEEVDLAKAMSAEAKANLKAVIDRLDAELRQHQEAYIQASLAFNFAVKNSEEIAANIEANARDYTAPQRKALSDYRKAKRALAKEVAKNPYSLVWPTQTFKERDDWVQATFGKYQKNVANAQAEVVRATRVYYMAVARSKTQQNISKFLEAEQRYQLQLQDELAIKDTAAEELKNATAALEAAKQKQDRSRKNKAAIKLATSDVNAALQMETEAIAAAEAKKAAEVAEMNATAKELADAEKEAAKADTIAERQRKQRERDNEALYTETIYDREERDRQLRRLENEARERLANIPGERMDFSKRREMLNVVDSSRETEAEINQNIADAQQALDQIAKNIELQTEAIANAKVTIDVLKPKKRLGSRQQAELDRAEQNLEDATKALEKSKEHKSLFEGVIDRSNRAIARLSERVAEINEAFSNDPDVAAKIKKSINGRIATRRSKILELSQKLNSLRDNEKNKDARTKIRHELAKLKREVRGLERLVETERGLVRTTVGVTPDAVSRLYDIAANTALPDNVREAAQAKITEYEEKIEAESLTAQPKPTKEDETEEAETARKQMRNPKRGPLVKDTRTGKVTQAGKSRPVTSLQAQRGAAKDVAFEQAMLLLDKVSDLRITLEAKREAATEANDTAELARLKELEKRLDAQENKQTAIISKYRSVLRTAVSSSGPTLQSGQVTRIANAIVKDWAKVPNIEVVDSVDDLLPRIQQQLREENEVATEVPGLYDPQTDTVFLISSALRSGKDVELTIMHEVAGHYGLRNMLGATYTKTMNDLYDGNKAVKQQADAKLEANPKLTREIAVEEVLADAAENTPYANQQLRNALRRFVSAIKQWLLQKLGVKNISDFEVLQLVADSRRYVRQGIGGRGGDVTTSRAVLRTTKPKYESENALTELADIVIAQPKSFKDRFINNAALKAEMETVDMRAGLREALKTGDTRNYQQAMYSVTKADQKMAVTYSALQNGAPEMYVDDKGFYGIKSERRGDKPTAVDIFEAVSRVPGENEQAKMALATTYMIAQRAANKGLTKLDLGNLGVTEAKLQAAMDAVNANPTLKASLENVRDKYNKYNAGLINFLADTGAIPKKTAEEFLKDGDYVPYYRVREDGVAELVFGGEKTVTIGDIRHQPYLAELKGGDTKILPLNESLPRNTMLLMDKALTNMATKNVAYALQDIGKGKGPIDEKTGNPKDLMPIHRGKNPGGSNVIVFNQEPDPKDPKDDGQRWLRVQTDGTIMGGIPVDLIVNSLEGAHLTLPSFLKLGGMAGDLLRSGVTRTPLYIMRQLIRDPMAATFTSGLDYGPLRAIYKATKEFVKMQAGSSVNAAKLIEKGLIQSQIFNGDPDDLSKFALQLASGKDQNALDSLLAMADRAAMSADAATRSLVYENAIKNGLSEVEADMMVMESMNFNKRGLSPTVQYASRLIPFFNAQIQGLNVLYKAARGNMPFEEQQRIKQKFFNNGMMLMATGLIYAMAMQDDEYYKNAKPKDRYTNFFLYIPGVKEPLKIPIPYEAGWFFSAAVATVDAMVSEVDTKQQLAAIKDMFLGSVPGYSSAGVPQLVKPVFEVWTNKNFFSGNNIESVGMQNKRTEDRYVAATTEMAKAMSRAAPILSPVQIEHLVRGYLGVMPIAAMAATNELFAKESDVAKPERRLTDVPLIGSAFQRQYGGADLDVVYKLAQDAMETNTSFNSLKKTGTPEDIRAFREAHKAELRAAPLAGTFKQNMARLKLQEDLITNRMPLTPEEKRARIDKIDKARQEMAELFMKRIKAIENQV
jgi:hypothetical protein